MAMNLSIALCTYNGEKYLTEQLASFLRQTRLPDELIVCDDRSTDETVEILEIFAADAPFPVRIYVNENNLGSTKNFERAISLCDGDIIFLSDQDDLWCEEKLEKFEREFAFDKEVGMVFCDGEVVDERLNYLGVNAWETRKFTEKRQIQMEEGNGLTTILNANVVTGCMMAFRAKYKSLFLPIPTDIPEVIHDYWIAIILLSATKVKLISDKLVKYRQHSQQQLGFSLESIESTSIQKRVSIKHDFEESFLKFNGLKKHFNDQFKESLKKNELNRISILDEINTPVKHFQARMQIAETGKHRFRLVLREFFSLRYNRYSNGWRSAVKDLSLYFLK